MESRICEEKRSFKAVCRVTIDYIAFLIPLLHSFSAQKLALKIQFCTLGYRKRVILIFLRRWGFSLSVARAFT